jgi:hypothetical protein
MNILWFLLPVRSIEWIFCDFCYRYAALNGYFVISVTGTQHWLITFCRSVVGMQQLLFNSYEVTSWFRVVYLTANSFSAIYEVCHIVWSPFSHSSVCNRHSWPLSWATLINFKPLSVFHYTVILFSDCLSWYSSNLFLSSPLPSKFLNTLPFSHISATCFSDLIPCYLIKLGLFDECNL